VNDPGARPVTGETRAPEPASDRDDVRALLAEVLRTRVALHEEQAQRGSHAQTSPPARQAALHALENYAAALQRHGWPLPPKMRLELHLLRSMCGQRLPNAR